MALCYCSLHPQLFSRRDQRWVPCSQETMDEIRGYYALLHATHAEASSLEVLEMSCAQCATAVRQIAQVHRNQGCASW
jgi:hypothetical protein